MNQTRRALVTGATGFVGSHLVSRLVADGWHVECVVRPGSDCSVLPAEAICRYHDGSTCGLADLVVGASPHVVFHLASLFVSEHVSEEVEPLVRSNVLFGAQLLEAMCIAGVDTLVNTGTAWQHYRNAEYEPVNLYAATKQAFEALARFYSSARGLRVLTLELSDTYGPDDRRPKLFTVLRSAASTGDRLAMSGGEQLVDLVYVDDVVDAYLVAASFLLSQPEGYMRSYGVFSGRPIRLRALVDEYLSATNQSIEIDWGARPYRQREVMVPSLRTPRLGAWQPSVGLVEGIQRMECLL